MAITGVPFAMKDTHLTLKLQAGADPATDYRCQMSAASLTPSAASGGNELATFCATYSDGGGDSTWKLDLEGFQSYADASDFALWAFEHEGEKAEFTLVPGQGGDEIGPQNPGFAGVVTVMPTVIGGTAKKFATFSVSLPVQGRPVKVTAAPGAAAVAAGKVK